MNLTKYTGITLLYFCNSNRELTAVQKSFVTNARTLQGLEKKIQQIKEKSDRDIKDNFCKYLGINDIFEINGQLKQGAILGRMVLWSYKELNSAKRLLKSKSEFWIYKNTNKPTKQYIAEVVFLLSSPVKYSDRRTIICNVLIEAPNKSSVFKRAINIGKSQELKNRLFEVLLQYEPKLTNELHFVGIANIKFVYDKVGVGRCFEALYKKERSSSSAKKLVFPIRKFILFFKKMWVNRNQGRIRGHVP